MREMKPPVSSPELAQHPLHPGTWMKPRSFTFVVLAGYWNTNHVDNVTLVDSCFVVDVVHCIRFLSSFTQSINQFDFLLLLFCNSLLEAAFIFRSFRQSFNQTIQSLYSIYLRQTFIIETIQKKYIWCSRKHPFQIAKKVLFVVHKTIY